MNMDQDILRGELVRLTVEDAEVYSKEFVRWRRDTHFWRLMDSWPAHTASEKLHREWMEKEMLTAAPDYFFFFIRTLDGNRLLGDIGMPARKNGHGDAFVGIAIGERELWGKGYGTDAMRVLLRYVFSELNLHRVSLNVFEYNPRAIRSYEKAGFKVEGRERKFLNREGRRWDVIYMGILREEWQALQAQP